MSKLDRNEVLNDLLGLCKNLDRVPSDKEIVNNGIIGCTKTLKRICQEKGYKDRFDFSRKHGYKTDGDVVVDNIIKPQVEINLEELIVLWKEYKYKHNQYPTSIDCRMVRETKENIPNWDNTQRILRENNMSLNKFYEMIDNEGAIIPVLEDYDIYIDKYIEISNGLGRYLKYKELRGSEFGMPNPDWLVKNCPNKDVKSFNDFVEWCGFIPCQRASKDKVIEAIYRMQSKLDRPLMYDDFRNPRPYEVGNGYVNKYWGTMNKMKEELGLEIIQEDMTSKNISISKIRQDLLKICMGVKQDEKRVLINTNDINERGQYAYITYYNYLRDNNCSVQEFLEGYDFEFQKCGRGIVTKFDDGEVTLSQYERMFTEYLRNDLDLKYNVDYRKDVKYSQFINGYDGLMSCDYVVNYNNRIIYIEIAGVLRNYKDWYYKDKKISSESREKYRLNLKEKEKMLKENNLEYKIIFPCDITGDFLMPIFKSEYKKCV